jgi:hypothetical protein
MDTVPPGVQAKARLTIRGMIGAPGVALLSMSMSTRERSLRIGVGGAPWASLSCVRWVSNVSLVGNRTRSSRQKEQPRYQAGLP